VSAAGIGHDGDVGEWQADFLASCAGVEGAAVSDGAFAPGPALWVGRREVAHFDGERTLDVRLTRAVIRRRRSEFEADGRTTLRAPASDWLEVELGSSEEDVEWARSLVAAAVEANRPTAPPGPPPTDADLERRRRFH
jgi:hypothetical protein